MAHTRAIDYFYICGLDETVGLEPLELGRTTAEMQTSPLHIPYKSRILQYFPDYVPRCSFDSESTALVTMPSGLRLFTQSCIDFRHPPVPQRHTFIITREDGNKVYGMSLVFHVQVLNDNILELVTSHQVAESGSIEGSIDWPEKNFKSDTDLLLTTRAIGVLSRHPFVYGLFGWLEDVWASMFLTTSRTPENIEARIYQLLYKTTLPSPGSYVIFPGPFRQHYGYVPGGLSISFNFFYHLQFILPLFSTVSSRKCCIFADI
ncbi:unnamed protein product [Echinostoma caproni]|uniref:UDENN domain-containing protein n=1 Tax=Echinostoma caproni TaxID=27848 RepID=A0A183ARL7_9TREM|nr:unnamed protein product [Echinostoma caproni]